MKIAKALIICAVSALIPGISMAGSSCVATMKAYGYLGSGISYGSAVSIIGCSGEKVSSSETTGAKTETYRWSGHNYSGNLEATFRNDQLVNKTQSGLN
ncbi:hypothetical protein [Rhizobium sp. R635]|uniref:hypothetical protein n=1 Tax=Rhizobium sp. R635 TaxID=1764275 RepID=UPI001130477D|nr:hypothetical protein [Rhizobium sp. R635]